MVEQKAFETEKAAILGGPYSQAVIHDGLIYLSGQGAVDPKTNVVTLGTIEEETTLAMENTRIILEEAGSSLNKILRVTVYLRHMKEYGRFNEVYRRYFKSVLPARTCVQVGNLPFGLRVEVSVTAYL